MAETVGQAVFLKYCVLCHGESGKGDGRMARLLENPTPADLTLSILSPQEIRQIIVLGGGGVGRSVSMPSWKGVVTDQELEYLVQFVVSLRESP